VTESRFDSNAEKELSILQNIQRESSRLGIDMNKHIVRVYDSFIYRGHSCIVMEAMGMNLRQFYSSFHKTGENATVGGAKQSTSALSVNSGSGIPLKLIKLFATQLFGALRHIHMLGYVHADIKVIYYV